MWMLLWGCAPRLCEVAEVTTNGTGAELFDVDGDGYADLTGACGAIGGAFGQRRTDFGLGQLLVTGDRDSSGKIDFALDTYVLAAADVWFDIGHARPGTRIGMEALAGSGVHKPTGEADNLYVVYPLTAGTVEFLDEREVRGTRKKVALEADDVADLRIRWDLEFGGSAQRWEGEDWVEFSNGIPIGDPTLPPDYDR